VSFIREYSHILWLNKKNIHCNNLTFLPRAFSFILPRIEMCSIANLLKQGFRKLINLRARTSIHPYLGISQVKQSKKIFLTFKIILGTNPISGFTRIYLTKAVVKVFLHFRCPYVRPFRSPANPISASWNRLSTEKPNC